MQNPLYSAHKKRTEGRMTKYIKYFHYTSSNTELREIPSCFFLCKESLSYTTRFAVFVNVLYVFIKSWERGDLHCMNTKKLNTFSNITQYLPTHANENISIPIS